jgi:hypothetical protein
MQYSYTFSGTQGWNPFSLTVIASTEREARERALNGICVAVRKELEGLLKAPQYYMKPEEVNEALKKVPRPTMPSDPIEDNTGNFCKRIREFFEPVFNDPRKGNHKEVPFDVWIKYAEVEVKPFNPYTIKVYSCLDG